MLICCFFYWSDDLFSAALSDIWQSGKLEIHDSKAMQHFAEKYEADRASLTAEGIVIPSFESYLLNQ